MVGMGSGSVGLKILAKITFCNFIDLSIFGLVAASQSF
jgi:hypothetical protein